MPNLTKRPGFAFLLGLVASSLASPAEGAFVTYTETTTGSGSLGASTFTNALLVFTQTADTANVTFNISGFYAVTAVTATVSVAGVGVASFTVPTSTANAPATHFGGIGMGLQTFGGSPILGVVSPMLANYDLKSSIGPFVGTAEINVGLNVATTVGNFTITSTAPTATFQAAVVPEPSSLVLGAIAGLIGLGLRSQRRQSPG